MYKFFLLLTLFMTLGFAEIIESDKWEYTAEIRFDNANIITDINCDSKIQDVLYFFNSEKKEFRNIICNAKLSHPFMDERNFKLSNISYDLVFENFDKILDDKFKQTVRLNDFNISSGTFKFDFSEYFILNKKELPLLVNKGPLKNKIINSDLFSLKDMLFSIKIKKGDYILDAFKGYQNLRLSETYILNANNISSVQRDITIDGLILDKTKTKITNSYKYNHSSCINGNFYFLDSKQEKDISTCNWVEL